MTLIVSVFEGLDDLSAYEDSSGIYVMRNTSHGVDSYVNDLVERIVSEEYKYIITRDHEQVRFKLLERGLKVITLFPSISLKGEYLKRYKANGEDPAFLDIAGNNWEQWINNYHTIPHCNETRIESTKMEDTILTLMNGTLGWETMWFRSIWNTKVLNPDNYGKNDETLTMEINHFINTVVTLNPDDFKLGLE